LDLDPIGSAVPRTPAVERRDHLVRAAVVVETVETGRDRAQQRGLAALVVVEQQSEAVTVEGVFAAQRAETVEPQPSDPHAGSSASSSSSYAGTTSLSRKASSP